MQRPAEAHVLSKQYPLPSPGSRTFFPRKLQPRKQGASSRPQSLYTTRCWAIAGPFVQMGKPSLLEVTRQHWERGDQLETRLRQTQGSTTGIPRLAELERAYRRASPGQNPGSEVHSAQPAYAEVQRYMAGHRYILVLCPQ